MQITFNQQRPVIYQSDLAFSETYGGIACLDGANLYALCSREFPHLHLVQGDSVISSCPVTSITYPLEQAQCFGLVSLAGGRQLGILLVLPNGRAFLEFAIVQGTSIAMQATAAVQLPQGFCELSYAADVTWDAEAAIGDSFPIGPLGTTSGLPQELFPNHPIGPALLACPPVITVSNEHIIIGINSLQILSLRHHHTMDYTPKSIFIKWVSQLSNVMYKENLWWEATTVTKDVQITGICHTSLPCPICGGTTVCSCGNKIPIWNEDGSPKVESRTFDRIKCTTILQHPTIMSSIIILNAATGALEGVHHIGGSAVGASLSDVKTLLITGIAVIEDTVHVYLANTTEKASREPLTWGDVPLDLASVHKANHPLHDFLLWWDAHHIPYLHTCTPMPPTFLRTPLSTDYMAKFPLIDLLTYPDIEASNNIIGFTKYPAHAPFNTITPPRDVALAPNQNKLLAISSTAISEYVLCWHKFTSVYKNIELGQDTDIHIGKVAKGIPKIVTVYITNTAQDRMIQTKLEIIPSFEYPYYMFVSLSLDGTTWAPDIMLGEILPGTNTTFYIKVECTTSVDDPKPVPLTVSYNLVV